jgi:hypothetical protein
MTMKGKFELFTNKDIMFVNSCFTVILLALFSAQDWAKKGHDEPKRADITDAPEILDLQKLAYQSEAAIYGDWSIPPLTQTLEELETEFEHMTFLKECDSGRLIGSVRASIHNETCIIGRLIVHPDF